MSAQVDWQREIDASFGDAPGRFDSEAVVVRGRRAARRRRTAWVAGSVAAVSVLGGVGWATGLNAGLERQSTTVAVDPPAQREEPGTTERGDSLLSYPRFSEPLVVRPGASILERTDDIIDDPDVRSTAAVVTFEGREWWAIAAVTPSTGWGADTLAISNRTFDQWVSEMVALNAPNLTKPWPSYWVYLDSQSVVSALHGATVVEQFSPARPDQAPTGAISATAMIDIDGVRLCVVARRIGKRDHEILHFAESEFQGCGETLPPFPYGPGTESQAP